MLAAVGFFQLLLDLTIEEAVIKFGFRYSTSGDWPRFARLFRLGLVFKAGGGLLAGVALLALAPLARFLFGVDGLFVPFLVAAAIPAVQAPEGMAAAALVLRGRYDVRAAFLAFSMAIRLAALAVGSRYGVTETVIAVVLGQAVATGAIATAGWQAFRRFPRARPEALRADRAPFRRFVVQSSIGTGLVSMRSMLGPLLLGLVTAPTQVAFFRAAQAPQQGFATLSSPARLILLTEQTRDVESGRLDRVYAMLRRYTVGAALLMAILLPPLLWFMPDLVRLAYGSSYGPASDAARLILAAAALQVVWGWTKSFPVSIGRPNLRIVAHGVEVAVLVPLLVAFGTVWGATGAAGAVLVSTGAFVLTWIVLLARLRRELPPPAVAPSAQTELSLR